MTCDNQIKGIDEDSQSYIHIPLFRNSSGKKICYLAISYKYKKVTNSQGSKLNNHDYLNPPTDNSSSIAETATRPNGLSNNKA